MKNNYVCNIYYAGKTVAASAAAGETLLEVLSRQDGCPVDAPCGGNGSCGKCRICVSGALSAPSDHEKSLLGDAIGHGIRLACLTKVEGDCTIRFEDSRFADIQTEGELGELDFDPLPGPYGLAVDIGTTTVACYLCDLSTQNTERIKVVRSFINPQRKFGADVISRIAYTMENSDGTDILKCAISDAVSDACNELCRAAGIITNDIGSTVITGNTVMQHLFCGDDASGIANAPFTPATLYGYALDPATLGLKLADGAKVYLTPCFAAYVGGDIASGIVAAGVDLRDGPELFIDIGTNGEMGLGGRNGFVLCATAAGPAFEGAHIECGMGGVEGAIRSVAIVNGKLSTEVIGGGEARGICGSGLIDAAACMLELGVLDETGYLEDDFVIDESSGVRITPADIRELQLAKASVCAGINTLLDDAGITCADVKRVVLAGGFGAHINRHSACRIGLIPPELEEKIHYAGNTAGMGAIALLSSHSARERIVALTAASRYLELSQNAFFMDEYIDQMMFE